MHLFSPTNVDFVHDCVVKKHTLPTVDIHSCKTATEGSIQRVFAYGVRSSIVGGMFHKRGY